MLGVTQVKPSDTFLRRRMWEIIWEKLQMSSDPSLHMYFLFSHFKNLFNRFFLFSTEDTDSVLLNLKIEVSFEQWFPFTLSCSLCFFLHSPSFIIVKSLRESAFSIFIFPWYNQYFSQSWFLLPFLFFCSSTFLYLYFISFSQQQNTCPLMFSQLTADQ